MGFALGLDGAGIWSVYLRDAVRTFDSRGMARGFIDQRLGVRTSVYRISGGLPTLGKRR